MMEKKLYIKPIMKIHIMKLNRLMVDISNTEIGDDFEEGAKGGFFDDGDNIPREKNVWGDF